MGSKLGIRGLWISTIAILATSGFQALTGHWVSFFLFWPGFQSLDKYLGFLNTLASMHRVIGFVTAGLGIAVTAFAFVSRPGRTVRLFALLGLVMVGLAATGGYLYVTSVFKDRWSLGQMADAFVGVFGAYFLQLLFMVMKSRGSRGADQVRATPLS